MLSASVGTVARSPTPCQHRSASILMSTAYDLSADKIEASRTWQVMRSDATRKLLTASASQLTVDQDEDEGHFLPGAKTDNLLQRTTTYIIS